MSKAPFGILIEAKLKPGTTIAARDAVTKIVKAIKGQASASKYWGYSTGTGQAEHFIVFCPFQKFADLDRPTTGEIAAKSKMNEDIDKLLTSLESNLESVHRSIVEYVPDLSNPPTKDAAAPGPNVYHVKAKLKPGHTLKAGQIAAKIAEAHRKAPNGVKYWGYTTAQGTGDTYHAFIPFDKYAELDGWPTTGEVLAKTSGASADALLTEIDGMIESSERSILSYVPGLSDPA
ncbi:hypothetical protein [Dyella subtropica]|uniref:hypothetical protein n=1 Tax=Dyella subtropica TaxID=2992127 RepID=UPI002254E45C|nr:hypothetical protein [Dyella subtropica]